MSELTQDLRYTFRNMSRSPGFALVAILTLALGIGANSAIFSVVYGVVLKPLPYPDPEELMLVTSQFPSMNFHQFWVSPPEYLEYQERNQSFEAVGAFYGGAVNVSGAGDPFRVPAGYVSFELLEALDVGALRGRTFSKQEDGPGAEPVAVLSYELWRRGFGADPEIVGKSVEVNGTSTAVVGVMPAGFDLHDQKFEIWLPLGLDPANPGGRGSHYLYLVGRLKDGVTPGQAQTELRTLVANWAETNPDQHVPSPEGHPFQMEPLQDDMVGGVRTALWTLLGAVSFVLLIACANVANLLLVRAEARRKEIAIRTSIGAGRRRLLRQFLTEGVVLSLLGAALGLALAYGGLRLLLATNPDSLPRSGEVALNGWVLLFTLAIALVTGIVFGLAPALHLTSRSLSASLKEGDQRTTVGSARHLLRRGLVVFEVAAALVLVLGSGLMLKSLWNVLNVDAGFDPSRLVTYRVALTRAQYPDSEAVSSFMTRLVERMRTVPGVEAATAMNGLPPSRRVNANDTAFEGLARTPEGPAHNTDYWQFATTDYFTTMGIPIVEGRGFEAGDVAGSTPVVVINETCAKTFWGDESPIGRRVRPGWGEYPWRTIVGVAKDVKQGGLDQETGTEVYFPFEQAAESMPGAPRSMNIVVRSALSTESLAETLRREVWAMDPSLPVASLRSMEEVFHGAVARPRFLALLLGIFAAVALMLAAIGTYGVFSYQVAERRQEIGIRIALGAASRNVLRLVLGQAFAITAAGIALGIAFALMMHKVMSSMLFGVESTDPATFVVVPLFLALVALVACAIPARRATRVDPIVVLRYE